MLKKLSTSRKFIIFSSTVLALVLAIVLVITPKVSAQPSSLVYEGTFNARGQTETREVFLRIDDTERDLGTPRFFIASVTGKPVVPSFRVVVLDWNIRYVIDNDADGRYELVVDNVGGNDLNVKYTIRELLF